MPPLQPDSEFSRIWSRRYQRAALWVAAAVAAYGLVALATRSAGAVLTQTAPATLLGLLLAALAVLLLAPAAGLGAPCRLAGRLAAAALLLLGLAFWSGHGPAALGVLPGVWNLCFVLAAASLLAKPWWPRNAVATDMFVGFLGYTVALERLFRIPLVRQPAPSPLYFDAGLSVFALSIAWMLSFPRQRPVGYFIEAGSAGTVLRRVLPVTLLFPVLLVALSALQLRVHGMPAQVGSWVLMLCAVIFGAALVWIIAAALDRMDHDRAAAERDLRLSEERYRLLFEHNPEPMWIYDAESLAFLDVNDSAQRVYGYTRAEFLAMRLPDLAPPGGESDSRRATKDGRVLEVEVFDQPATWYGRPARVAFVHDVTLRRHTEAQLRESEARVRILLESTIEGILAVDTDGRCVWCNPAVVRLLGYDSAADLMGKNAHELFHHSHADGTPYPAAECPMAQAVGEGRALAFHDETLWRANGSSFPADYRSSPLRRDGHIVGAVVTFADVSERKSLQAQFQQAQKMEAVGRLAAGIAHDFNNLLTVINGYAEMLLRRPDADVPAKAVSIRKAGERAAGLTQQLLAFSRQQVLQPQVLNLNAVLAEMDPLLRRILGEDLALETHLAPHLAGVRADPGQIGQVLMNLVVNARDAMPNGGRLTLETGNVELDAHYAATHPEVVPGPYVMLAVTDNGAGMDAATLAHIFEPFFTTKPAGQGTGLGLATVFGIVKQSGGSVAAYSELGRGTSMKIYLPSLGAAATATAAPAPVAAALRGRETLLIVEDEESVRHLVCEVLQESGYTVLAAASPVEALALCDRYTGPLDLLVTDVVMPGLDGRRLANQLLERRPGLAVLFISGYPDKAIAHNRELDASLAFIQKPFTPEALARKVRAVLDAHPGAQAAATAS